MIDYHKKVNRFKREAIANGEAQLIRVSIMEITNAKRYIDEQNLTGLPLELAMEQLRQLSVSLNQNLQNFRYLYY